MQKRVVVFGGGTVNKVKEHLALSAPAFGTVARWIHSQIGGSELILTKMADHTSDIISNVDLVKKVDELLLDEGVGVIVFSCAVCDFFGLVEDESNRLDSSKGYSMSLHPDSKIISKIRRERPDIFLVGFKTTAGDTSGSQFMKSLKMMKSTKCNLVFSNDVITKRNSIITPEEAEYTYPDRESALHGLIEFIKLRSNLTYKRTKLINIPNKSMEETPETFQKVVKFLVDHGGFMCNNGNGFTPGHFCWSKDYYMLSSQRKADHNKVFEEGLTLVSMIGDDETVCMGTRKPSVGATSQILIFNEYPEYDCIVHTHNPLTRQGEMLFNTVQQMPYQCGSIECGWNTANGMEEVIEGVLGVYLNKHGPVLLFKSSDNPEKIINLIKWTFRLGVKVV